MFQLRRAAEKQAANIPELRALAIDAAYHILQGTHARKKAGSGDAFWQFREYQNGDAPRDIDWRQSAKTSRIYIKQKEHHTPQNTVFWCKQNADMDFGTLSAHGDKTYDTKHKHAAIIALTLALLHTRSGEQIKYADAMQSGHSQKTLTNFEQCIQTPAPAPLADTLKIPRHATFYALSDFLETPEDIEAALAPISAQTRNGWLIQTLTPAELDLPYNGRIMFENMNGDHRTLVNNASDIREAYRTRIQNHMANLQTICAKYGWRYVLHRTDTSFKYTLMKIWLESQHLNKHAAGT